MLTHWDKIGQKSMSYIWLVFLEVPFYELTHRCRLFFSFAQFPVDDGHMEFQKSRRAANKWIKAARRCILLPLSSFTMWNIILNSSLPYLGCLLWCSKLTGLNDSLAQWLGCFNWDPVFFQPTFFPLGFDLLVLNHKKLKEKVLGV